MPVCSKCLIHCTFPSIQALKIHYKVVHSLVPTSAYQCAEENCLFKKTFGSWARMRKHYCYHHKFHLVRENIPQNDGRVLNIGGGIGDVFLNDNAENHEIAGGVVDNDPNLENFNAFLTRRASQVVAKFYSRPSFPRSIVQLIVDDIGNFIEDSVLELKKRYELVFQNLVLEEDRRAELMGLLDDLSNPFNQLSSDYLRLKFFENSGHLLPAEEVKVGERYENKFVNNRMVRVAVPCTATHIKLRFILKSFFELPGVFQTVSTYMNNLQGDNLVLRNFVQGNLWKQKAAQYVTDNKTVFPLFLGIDDLEINNALGSHTGVSEVGAVYASIPCIPPEFYSRLENIFLTFLYHSQDRKLANGNYNVFRYIVDELNYLAREGILIKHENENKRIYFVLGLILGDNKGLNEVLGFSGGFSANYFCRYCRRHKNDCSNDCEELPHFIRQPEQYDNDVRLGMEVSGVKERSVWLDVDNFHPYKNFASCTLHDFDEGISKYAMPLICHYFILDAKIFDRDFLNQRLLSFNYQVNGFSNKIMPISDDNLRNCHFRMSGSEMRTLVLCFNLLVGDHVPLENEVWQYYLVLRRLIEYVASKAFPKDSLSILEGLIRNHNELFKKLFGPLKPKMHLLLHYIRILIESGAIPYLSMIRNEGKHKEIKESAAATNSRKNVTHTFALKQQLKLCYRFTSGQGLENETLMGRSQVIQNLETLDNFQDFANTVPNSFLNNPCIKIKWTTYKGIKYRNDMCVVLDVADDSSVPSFGVIKYILSNALGEICLICIKLLNLGYDCNMGAYEVENSVEWQCILIEALVSPFPAIKDILSTAKCYVSLRCLL